MPSVSSSLPMLAAVALHHLGGGRFLLGGRRRAALRQDVGAALAADLDREAVPVALDAARSARRRSRSSPSAPSPSTRRSTCPPADAAVDRHDERGLAPVAVVRVGMLAIDQHAILDGDGVQLAGADADERVARRLVRHLVHLEGPVLRAARLPEASGPADAGSASTSAARPRSRSSASSSRRSTR